MKQNEQTRVSQCTKANEEKKYTDKGLKNKIKTKLISRNTARN